MTAAVAAAASDADSRIKWAKSAMERAYRIEAGLEEAPAAERAGSGARPRPQARAGGAMLTTGEAAAAENEALMTDIVSAVERERLERMRKNQAMMAQLGLLDAAGDLSEVLEEEKAAKRPAPRKRREKVVIPMEQRRRTGRDRKQAERFGDLVPDEFVLGPASHGFVGGERGSSACAAHGEVDGVEVGRLWLARVGVSRDGVHGPWVGGIHGNANSGAFSVVLSGGYEGDVDRGTEFSYTGSGGRDLSGNKRTAPQSSDQQLEGSNLALAVSMWRKLPLRVVRGFKSQEKEFAPAEGYRYDGLYDVVNVWPEIGESGFVIWRYHLKRREGQAPCPWEVPGWREAEAAEIARLKREQGDAPLIPLGSGTTVLGVAPKRRGGKSAGDDGAAKRGKSSV